MNVDHSATIAITSDTTLGRMKQELETAGVPDDAKPHLDVYRGDQHDPGYSKIRFSWTTRS